MGDATTAGRIGAPRLNHPVRRLSAGPYDGRRSRPGSKPRLPSPSTRGRQGRNCGSRTTGGPASWVEWTMTTSSSATSPVPFRRRPILAGASASCADFQLGRPGQSFRRHLPGHIRVPWELLGSPKLPPAAERIPPGLHPAIFEAAHRAAQHHRLRCHRRVPRRHHLPRPSEQAGPQDSHQGERADGHRLQVCLWLGGGRGHLLEGQAASGAPTGRRPRGIRSARHQEEGQEEVASETRRHRRRSYRRRRAQEPSKASRRRQPVRQDAQGVVPLSSESRQAHP
jgi:hypothetical protein